MAALNGTTPVPQGHSRIRKSASLSTGSMLAEYSRAATRRGNKALSQQQDTSQQPAVPPAAGATECSSWSDRATYGTDNAARISTGSHARAGAPITTPPEGTREEM